MMSLIFKPQILWPMPNLLPQAVCSILSLVRRGTLKFQSAGITNIFFKKLGTRILWTSYSSSSASNALAATAFLLLIRRNFFVVGWWNTYIYHHFRLQIRVHRLPQIFRVASTQQLNLFLYKLRVNWKSVSKSIFKCLLKLLTPSSLV